MRTLLSSALFLGVSAVTAFAGNITVNSADNIYGAGQSSAPGGGNLPGDIVLSPTTTSVDFGGVTGSLTSPTYSCASPSGCVTLNGYGNFNDADGVGAGASTSSNTGAGSLSGLAAPGAGYLVGVFVAANGPSGAAPTNLDFTTGSGTSFTTLAPQLDQVFFIGDGLTGDGTGATQIFQTPTGAAFLYLGISDAGGYNGAPGAYGDNFGSFSVNYSLNGSVSPTPEPQSFVLLGLGTLVLGVALRRRTAIA